MRLDGKVAIVTGGSRGIGRAICLGLGDAARRWSFTSRTEVDESAGTEYARHGAGDIGDTAAQITARGGAAIPVRCDVAQVEDIQGLVDAALARFGRIDILVCNAGMDCESPVVDLDVELLDPMPGGERARPLLLCKYALPSMIAQGDGGSIYCVTSGAARNYREGGGLFHEQGGAGADVFQPGGGGQAHNIAVNVLEPGRVDTWMNRRGDWPGTAHIPMVQPEALTPPGVWLAGQTAETLTGALVSRADFGVTWGPKA